MGRTPRTFFPPDPFGQHTLAGFPRLGEHPCQTAKLQKRRMLRKQPLHAFPGIRRKNQTQTPARLQQTLRDRKQFLERQGIRMPRLISLRLRALQRLPEIRRIRNDTTIRPRRETVRQIPVIQTGNRQIFPITGTSGIGQGLLERSRIQIQGIHPRLPRLPAFSCQTLSQHQGNQAATAAHIQKAPRTLGRKRASRNTQGFRTPTRYRQAIPDFRSFRQARPCP